MIKNTLKPTHYIVIDFSHIISTNFLTNFFIKSSIYELK